MTDVLKPYNDAAGSEKIISDTQLWLERAVIGLNLCPFAKSVFVKKQIRYALTAANTADELLAELPYIERFFRYVRGQGYIEQGNTGEVHNMIAA